MQYILSTIFFLILTPLVAQNDMDTIKINYSANGIGMSKIFSELEAEYGIRFSYATSSILDQPIEVDFKDESIDEVLDFLLNDQNMEYKVVSNNILIRKGDDYSEHKSDEYFESIHLKGRVLQPGKFEGGLELATIAISNTPIGTYTDEDGRFDLEIPGQYLSEQLVFHALGYEDQVFKIEELKDSYVMVAMQTGGFSIEEITIVNREKPIRLDQNNNSIGINSTQLNSTTSGIVGTDFSRQLQLLPGISAQDDTSSEIKIRGSSGDATMIILDGMPIYHSSHYYGIFSNINTSFVDSANIYKNNYPLQYDGKIGGVVELFSNKKQIDQASVNLDVNLLVASVDAMVPISSRTVISVAGRTTLDDISNSQFNTFAPESSLEDIVDDFRDSKKNKSTDPKFKFYDLNAKLQQRLRSNDMLSIQFFKSNDDLSNRYERKIEDSQQDRLELLANEQAHWDNTALGMDYEMNITSTLQWNTCIHHTRYDNEMTNDYRIEAMSKGGMQGPPLMNKISEVRSKQVNRLTDTGIDSHLSKRHGNHIFKLGISAIQHDLLYKIEENKNDQLEGGKLFFETGLYAGYQGHLFSKLNINTGLRASHFDSNRGSYLSPRISLNYALNKHINIKSSYGYYQQVVRQFRYEYRGEPMALWVSAGQNNIPVLKSHSVMSGATFKFDAISIDVELYRKDMEGMLEYAVLDPGNGSADTNISRDYNLFKGDGKSKGIDILVSSGYKNYDTYLSYSLSKSDQRFDAIAKNEYFATEDDRRHQLKWINTYRTGKILWGINGIYISGRRYTDIENLGEAGNITESQPDQRFKRLPAYERLDISATFDLNISKFKSSLSLAVFNLVNNGNVKYVQSVSTAIEQNQTPINTVIGSDSNLLGRTINLTLKVGI